MITGIDLSEKNGEVEWNAFGFGDVNFVFLKATEAIDSVDRNFVTNLHQAQQRGITTGAYHWLHPRLHVGQQAELFINTVKDFKGLLPPVVCLETHRTNLDEMEKNVLAFLDLIEQALKVKPIIYTSDQYWKTYLPEAKWGCDYLLWFDKPGTIWPPQLWPWAGWTFWQYSYQAKLPGIPTMLGLNYFNGSMSELQQMVIQ
ncbi:MAG: GH25 family lysozyme [Pelolinea sp.]|nr:GH25 family lysozyme [Pelolinea sp.]